MRKKLALFLVVSFLLYPFLIGEERIKVYPTLFVKEWIKDKKTGCKVLNPNPLPNESISWSGKCVDGKAHGKGVLKWYKNNRFNGMFEGEYKNGKRDYGTYTYANGDKEERDFGWLYYSGTATYTYANGDKVISHFEDGKKVSAIYTYARRNKKKVTKRITSFPSTIKISQSKKDMLASYIYGDDMEVLRNSIIERIGDNSKKYKSNWYQSSPRIVRSEIASDKCVKGNCFDGEGIKIVCNPFTKLGDFRCVMIGRFKRGDFAKGEAYYFLDEKLDRMDIGDFHYENNSLLYELLKNGRAYCVDGRTLDGGFKYKRSYSHGQWFEGVYFDEGSISFGEILLGIAAITIISAITSDSSKSNENSSSISSSRKGILFIVAKHSGVFADTELDKYFVKVRKTHNLDGEASYGYVDERTGSGKFLGTPATFYGKEYGYYEIECYGYDKYSKKIFHIKWSNVEHKCQSTNVTIYSDSTIRPYVNCY